MMVLISFRPRVRVSERVKIPYAVRRLIIEIHSVIRFSAKEQKLHLGKVLFGEAKSQIKQKTKLCYDDDRVLLD
jgi:hypothetical protein